jgi:hypothetical protein
LPRVLIFFITHGIHLNTMHVKIHVYKKYESNSLEMYFNEGTDKQCG